MWSPALVSGISKRRKLESTFSTVRFGKDENGTITANDQIASCSKTVHWMTTGFKKTATFIIQTGKSSSSSLKWRRRGRALFSPAERLNFDLTTNASWMSEPRKAWAFSGRRVNYARSPISCVLYFVSATRQMARGFLLTCFAPTGPTWRGCWCVTCLINGPGILGIDSAFVAQVSAFQTVRLSALNQGNAGRAKFHIGTSTYLPFALYFRFD